MATLEARLAAAFQRVAGVVGAPIDWAAQLAAGLNPPSATGAATKTVPGIMRFATAAEAAAGTLDTVGVTPLGLGAAKRIYKVASLPALNTLGNQFVAAGIDNGELAVIESALIPAQQGVAQINYAMYFWLGNAWFPLSVVYLGQAATITDYVNALAGLSRVLSTEGTRVNSDYQNQMFEYKRGTWVGTTERVYADWVYNPAFPVVTWDNNFFTENRIIEGGKRAELILGCRKNSSSPWAAGDLVLVLGPNTRPAKSINTPLIAGYGTTNGWATGSASLNIGTNGTVTINGVSPNVTGLFGNIQYPLT